MKFKKNRNGIGFDIRVTTIYIIIWNKRLEQSDGTDYGPCCCLWERKTTFLNFGDNNSFIIYRDRILSELVVREEGDLFNLWREPPINPIMKVG